MSIRQGSAADPAVAPLPTLATGSAADDEVDAATARQHRSVPLALRDHAIPAHRPGEAVSDTPEPATVVAEVPLRGPQPLTSVIYDDARRGGESGPVEIDVGLGVADAGEREVRPAVAVEVGARAALLVDPLQ